MGGFFAVAEQAKGAQVVEIALTSALGDGKDVIGVPERSTRLDRLHTVDAQAFFPGETAGPLQGGEDGEGVGFADGAAASVPGKDLVAQIAGVGPEPPLVNARVGAEGSAPSGEDLKIAPAAERQAIGSATRIDVTMCPAGLGENAGWMGSLHGPAMTLIVARDGVE